MGNHQGTMEILGESAAKRNLSDAQGKLVREERQRRPEKAQAEFRAAQLRKRELSNRVDHRVSSLLRIARGYTPSYPHEGREHWTSDWKPIAEREGEVLYAQLEESFEAKQVSGYDGARDFFSYHRRSRTTRVNLKTVSGAVEGLPVTAILIEDSAMNLSWGDPDVFVYPKRSLHGFELGSAEGTQAIELVGMVEEVFVPADHPYRGAMALRS